MFKIIKKLFKKKPKEQKKEEPLVLKKEINHSKDTKETKSSLTYGV
jgi:hypothetical protein